MNKSYDLVAIGAGSAASAVAHKCRKNGWSVAVVDSQPFGGACALRGCDPKKVLVGAAELVDWHRRMAEKGVSAHDVKTDWQTLVEEGTDRILGAHVLGPHAGEVINIFAMAIRRGIPAGEVRRMVYAYPTSSSDIAYML